MNKKWSEMTPAEKKKFIAICAVAALAFVFVVLDLTGVWKNKIGTYMISALFLIEGVLNWKDNTKMAILDIVLAIVWLLGTL